jgi:hypothetical protein
LQLDHKFWLCTGFSGVFTGCGFMGDLLGISWLCT